MLRCRRPGCLHIHKEGKEGPWITQNKVRGTWSPRSLLTWRRCSLSIRPGMLGTIGIWRWWSIGAPWGRATIWSSRSSRREPPRVGVCIGPSTSWWSIRPSRGRTSSISATRGYPASILPSSMGESGVVATRRGSGCLSSSSWAALQEEQDISQNDRARN